VFTAPRGEELVAASTLAAERGSSCDHHYRVLGAARDAERGLRWSHADHLRRAPVDGVAESKLSVRVRAPRVDAPRLQEGDVISVRGLGRVG